MASSPSNQLLLMALTTIYLRLISTEGSGPPTIALPLATPHPTPSPSPMTSSWPPLSSPSSPPSTLSAPPLYVLNATPSPSPSPMTSSSPPLSSPSSPPSTMSAPPLYVLNATPSPSPSPPKTALASSPRPPPPSTETPHPKQLLNDIIEALIGTGDFGSWAGILSAAESSSFPLTATLFIPSNDALSHFPTPTTAINFDPFIIPYHIVPQRLSFSDLRLFKTHTRLPTLLPPRTLLITNNSPSNFTIDDSPVTHPDLYITSAVSVHGIKAILDYSKYGGDIFSQTDTMPTPTPPEAMVPPFVPAEEIMDRRRSDAACLCAEFPIVFPVVCAALAFKIHRNPLYR